ncbi:unnamed protein product [Rotaria socialis]
MNTNADQLTRSIITTTTQMKIIRRIEVTPTTETISRFQSTLNQPFAGYPRLWTNQNSIPIALNLNRRSQKMVWFTTCLFISVGLLAVSVAIIGLVIAFRKDIDNDNENYIERYDLGDLYYGINILGPMNFPSKTHLSAANKILTQNYLSNQLRNHVGFRILSIDKVFVQDQSITNEQKQRSCSIFLIFQNIQIYFNGCSNCADERNSILRRSFFNLTAFRQPFHLLFNDHPTFIYICSAPNTVRFILPIRDDNPKLMYSTIKSSSSSLKTKKTISTTKISPTSSTTRFQRLIETTNSVSYFKSSIVSTIDYLSTITQFDTSQMQETSTVFLNEVQTSNYIEETTELPAYISTSIKQETTNDQQLRLSTESSITTEIYFPKTLPSMFQFLPFRPSMNTSTRFTRRPYNNSSTTIKINATQQTPLTQRRNRLRQKYLK